MTKIAIAGGHSKKAPGASRYLDEYECDRAYVARLLPALAEAGYDYANCSNEGATQSAELAGEVCLANGSEADIFMAFHFNDNSKDPDDKTTGTEVWYYEGNEEARKLAEKLSANIAAALGVRDRGAKPTKNLYVLRNTDMLAVLVEVCFVDDKDDAAAWKRTPWADLTKAVIDALGGKTTAAKPSAPAASKPKPSPKPASNPDTSSSSFHSWVKSLQKECNKQGFGHNQPEDGIPGSKTLAGCPTLKSGARGNITKLMQQRLIALGYSVGKYGADGVFGEDTKKAVKAFQTAKGLSDDAVVGRNTWRKLLGL